MTVTVKDNAPIRVLVREPGAAERDPGRARTRRRLVEIGLAVAVPVLLLLWWQLAANQGWVDDRLYPAPSTIVADGWTDAADGKLWPDVWATLARVLPGYAIGAFGGFVVGLLMGTNALIRAALEPTLDALYVVPKLALLPIFMTMFGLGEAPHIALVAVTVFFFVWIATMAAVIAVPDGYREAGAVFGAGPWQMFRHVLLPASLPQVMVGLRISAGVAVLVIIASEGIASPDNKGLGYVIFNSRQLFDNRAMFVGIIVVAIVGVLFSELIRYVGRVCTPWAPRDRGPGQS
ncbi:ABC transporter permease [Embleya sp. NPDC008237]|uniref:ABC transporter permease n=1 Tax=unclassified Embleya TaxID=2699296 RepID=UPI0036E2DB83